MRKLSAFQSGVGTLNDFASSRLFEKLPLGNHSLRAGSLTDGDFDHGRGSCGETRVWQVPETLTITIMYPLSESDGATKLGPKAKVDLDHVSVKLEYVGVSEGL